MSDRPTAPDTPTPGEAPALGGARALKVRVETLAGDGTPGWADGHGREARFQYPRGLAVDAAGVIYVADWEGHRIRRIAPDGTVSTLAGIGLAGYQDGAGVVARFRFPRDVAVDAAGHVYVADTDNQRIRKITPQGLVTTHSGEGTAGFADGPRGTARFYYPNGVALDAAGNLYVGDATNYRVRRVTPGGTASTVAGDAMGGFADAVGPEARFYSPRGVAVDSAGKLFVSDYGNSRIRMITPDGRVTTFAGDGRGRHADGPGPQASFVDPGGIAFDAEGHLYVADGEGHCIRRISPEGMVVTIAGGPRQAPDIMDGPGPQARFNTPRGLAVGPDGTVYVADTNNHLIRRLILE